MLAVVTLLSLLASVQSRGDAYTPRERPGPRTCYALLSNGAALASMRMAKTRKWKAAVVSARRS
jgi:hypothetical protein